MKKANWFNTPISTHWQNLTRKQAWILVATGILLEIVVRWIVRPDMGDMRQGNPWFNLPLRLGIEIGFVAVIFLVPRLIKAPLRTAGLHIRRWTGFEWGALAFIGAVELTAVIGVAGEKWPEIFGVGLAGQGILWALSEYLFGVNQETGFRGLIMTGMLKLKGVWWAVALNTLLFLVGPLHGPGLLELMQTNLVGAAWMSFGIVMTGLLFSWLRWRTDNLILCAVLHGIVNGFWNGATLTLRANL